jgi:hypothetical protein
VEEVRRKRSATESLLSITLALEAFLVFFAALTAFALEVTAPAVALGGGAAFIVLLVLCARLVRYSYGVWLGWALQGMLIATGILMPLMFIIGAGFLALWIFCFVKGRSLDRISTGSIAETGSITETNKETP